MEEVSTTKEVRMINPSRGETRIGDGYATSQYH
jgi:hypothetical protein